LIRQFELVERLKAYDPTADEDLLNRAYVFSMKAHGSQLRESGDPYFSHPIEVAGILVEMRLDCYSIVTALLHDTVEDTVATLEEIESLFGNEIARLVNGVTKLSQLELQSEETKQAENFRKLVVAMSSDIRVLLVKLADRLHNMRTLHYVIAPEKRRRIARETMEIYVPLAERMGMQSMKDELEDLSFSVLNAEMHESIKSRLRFLHESSENTIETILNDLKRVVQEEGLECNVSGRLKTPYSIWGKMQKKNITFEQLSDIMAFRLVVNTVAECYQALGIMHSRYHLVPGRFKDYISTPKANNYRSLHTGLIGPLNHRIEIQIRTKEMHQTSELGVAAHWQYKKNAPVHEGKQYAWLRSLLEILEQASGPEEFLEHTKLEMFKDQVFCFTPKGELIPLPRGGTPIDFAYAIHSDIGDRTVGAKINGRQMPLRTQLQNGDQVEIITVKNQCPSPTWERFVVTGKARARIRRFIRIQQRDQFSELGKSLLQKACIKESLPYSEKAFIASIKHFQYTLVDDLFAAIGEGIHSAKEVLAVAYPDKQRTEDSAGKKPKKNQKTIDDSEGFVNLKSPTTSKNAVCIKGLIPGMAVHYAGCCHPLPGDKIIGVITTGKGVTIHTHDCEGVSTTIDPERVLDLSWQEDIDNMSRHVGRLKVIFINKAGSLASMTTSISKLQGNIVNLKITNRTSEFWDLFVDVEVKNVNHLQDIQAALRNVPIINYVARI
jgi:GTP diphosphokinase / guanosine-3',5'-bis(diphosphate) 3'-diphosphatase